MRPVRRWLPLALLFAAAPAAAHHGWAEYGGEPFALDGVVREVRLGTPHGLLRVEDATGRVWDAVLASPGRTRAAGLVEGSVAVGDRVRAEGRRRKGGGLELKTERLIAGDRRFDVYPERLAGRR